MSQRGRPMDLAARLRANAAALEVMVGSGSLSRPLLRALAADLKDFAQEADDYAEARALLAMLPR